jgi:hypothetical protein
MPNWHKIGNTAPLIPNHFSNSIPHSGQAGFFKIKPTFGQHSLQNMFLHLGHCQAVGFINLPISLPQTEQNPLTMHITTELISDES